MTSIATLLQRRGHAVEVLERSSAAAGRGAAARGLLLGGLDPEEVARAVRGMRADIVHAHNIQPLLGWRALAAARAEGARTILHLHNFRLYCAIAIGYRDGAPCFRCHGVDTRPGLRLRCRGSVAEAAVYAAGLSLAQPQLFEHVDRFVCVSGATRARLRWLGLPDGRSDTLANFVFSDEVASGSGADSGEYALVSGRLVEEKGFDTAVAAAGVAGVPLVVAGEGPDEGRLRGLAGSSSASVRFTGWLDADALAAVRALAAVALVPSRWEEPCPYAVLDALASGVPVLASDRGGLPELVGAAATVAAGDVGAWTRALSELWRDPARRRARGEEGLARARSLFGEEGYYRGLMRAYSGGAAG